MRDVKSTLDADYSAIHADEQLALLGDDADVPTYASSKEPRRRNEGVLTALAFAAVAITAGHTISNPASAALAEQWATTNIGGAESKVKQVAIQEDRNAELSTEILAFEHLPAGWDGPGSIAPSREAVADALAFLDLLPAEAGLEVLASADGEISFFKRTPDSYIDVGFRGDGRISYFARAIGERAKDVKPFGRRAIPKNLLRLIALA